MIHSSHLGLLLLSQIRHAGIICVRMRVVLTIVEGVGSLAGFGWIAGDYGPSLFLQSLAVAVGMGLVGTLYPAWRAVRITPIEALRYE